MNERERAILRGKPITPQTEDEAALKAAVQSASGLVTIDLSSTEGVEWDSEDEQYVADETVDGRPIYAALTAGKPVWLVGEQDNVLAHTLAEVWAETDDGLTVQSELATIVFAYYKDDEETENPTLPVNPPVNVIMPVVEPKG